jgi:hypothetical protein
LKTATLITCLCIATFANCQTISSTVPRPIDKSAKYLFYLHGGVVTNLGNNAINQSAPEWGPYQYLSILDSLRSRGFNVISENRKKDVDDSVYVAKLVAQVDTLLRSGVKADKILIVGASAGWDIAIRAASALKNNDLRFVIMGGCWPNTYKTYTGIKLYGRFLSVYEASDPHQSCATLFENRNLTAYKEIRLNTGLSHGFIYKGHKEWIDPIVEWFTNAR